MSSVGAYPIEIRGLTWTHPRGYAPLTALASIALQNGPLSVPGSTIRWERQDLAGFESNPIANLAERYDLLVLDHPGLGSAIAADALVPLDELLPASDLAAWSTVFVGDALRAYQIDGRQWAVPIDAATQVAAYRPDLIETVPTTWDEVAELSHTLPVCLPTKAPHTLLTLLGIAAAIEPGFVPNDDNLVPAETGYGAFDLLAELVNSMPEALLSLDPIEILEAMSAQSLPYCPLLYGYVNYCRPADDRATIRFANAPRATSKTPPGSVLGGTGLAISRHSEHKPAALDHLRQISSERAQVSVVPQVGGQPSAARAWGDAKINAQWGDFYTATLESQLAAWRRPATTDGLPCNTQRRCPCLTPSPEVSRRIAQSQNSIGSIGPAGKPQHLSDVHLLLQVLTMIPQEPRVCGFA